MLRLEGSVKGIDTEDGTSGSHSGLVCVRSVGELLIRRMCPTYMET